jgi:Stage II sporulation protein E (SpoIIE)
MPERPCAAPQETLLLYTDGPPESGGPGEQLGEDGMFELCESARHLTLSGLLERLVQAASMRAAGTLRDGIALMAVRLSR